MSADENALSDERVRLWRQIRAVDPSKVVRGQYRGYTDEIGVEPGSDVETFVALQVDIESWRWAGCRGWSARARTCRCTPPRPSSRSPSRRGLLFAKAGRGHPSPTDCASG